MSEVVGDGWRSARFGSLCLRIVNGGTPDTANAAYWNGEIPWITGADFTPSGIGEFRRFVSNAGIHGSATSVVKRGNLLVVTRTGVGKLAVAPCDIAISQDITGVYIDTEVAETDFIYYLLSREVDELKKLNQGTSINGIVRSDLEKHEVQFPIAKLVQKRITVILRTIDAAIEKTEALIDKFQQIKAGLMHDLFTRGVLPNGQLRPPREQSPEQYQETAIGWIPREWSVERLLDLTSVIVDGVHHTPKYAEHGVPFVTVKNLTAGDGIDFSDLNHISESDHEVFKRRASPQAGDVLITKDGTLGVARVVKASYPEFSIFVSVALLRTLNQRLISEWLFLFFDARIFERQLGFLSAGTGLKHIHLEHFKKFSLPLPDTDEQERICDSIRTISRKISNERCTLKKLRHQKLGLMQDLLTGKVPVPVDTPEVALA